MMVLVTYDVSLDEGGAKRLRKVAKACENIGQRVQKSVFECIVDSAQFVRLKSDLLRIIDPRKDSLRIYLLGKNWRRRVENYGVALRFEQDGPLIL
ncbi:MAG: CRISPR-associated endonuclease Cas2 [Candidatus Desulforudis sp.]|nr:CRISPR-associated endonuclease Cas2 [Desulforudis sp.]MBV1734201.1 CRISPR-associated endonuclease Cas2 [Desulforudis sp.]